jgi:glycosyltransferase involved in cell wall biosynthesis
MTREPKINVTIPTCNRSDLLRFSLQSVLSQDYADFSITLLDNASTDDTEAVVKSFSDSRIRYVRHETNIGLFRNFNRAIEINTSPYLVILQDDDVIHPGFMRKSLAALERYPQAGLSFTDSSFIDASGTVVGAQRQTENFPAGLVSGTDYLRRIVAGENLVIHVSGVLMRATALEAVGPFDTVHARTSIDFNLYFKLAAHFDMAFVADDLVQIRRHDRADHLQSEADTRPLAMLAERMDAAGYLMQSDLAQDAHFRQWLAERLLYLGMRRSEMTSQLLSDLNLSLSEKQQIAAEEIAELVPPGESIIVLDENEFGPDIVSDRKYLPFLEHEGQYWGPPADDETAVRELERMRRGGPVL